MKLDNPHLDHFPSLVAMFFDRAERGGESPFLWHKADRAWQPLSWRQVANQVAALAHNLRALGLKEGDRVVLVSENRPEFCIADLAIMAAGCITVPTYTTNTERDHQHILDNSGARAVIVSTAKLARTLMPAVMRSDAHIVISMESLRVGQQGEVAVHDWAPLVEAGAAEVLVNDFGIGDEEVFLSFLPLSHAYEHSGGQFLPIMVGAQIYYSEGLEKLVSNIEETKPTIMVVVPRLFEVIRARMIKSVEKQGKLANWMLSQALRVGEKDYERRLGVLDRPVDLILNKLFRPKIQQRFGGRMKALVSGGAPLNPEIGVFFHSIGLTLLQGYGQTEAGPVISCNRPSVGLKMDTVGPPLMNTEVRIADDGEICVRGELVMKGYWRNKEETARVLVPDPAEPDKGPWLHTGDIGHIDDQGRIVITDRKKDLIVNDKGDNVSPQRVEGMLTLQPEILQAMVYGDKRPHLVGILVPDPEWMAEWAEVEGLPKDLKLLREHEKFRTAIREAVDRVNGQLSVIEKVRKFDFADEPFTIENEQMTPSMKIRRHILRKVYEDKIAALYKG